MFLVLEKFGFPKKFINMIKLFYNNISCTVINNGTTCGYFPVYRGVRQGDPLSPYLFILSIEILGLIIRQRTNIGGIKLENGDEIKISQYADDTVAIVNNIKSAKNFLESVKKFGTYSALNMNKDKSEGYWMGSLRASLGKHLNIAWPTKGIKILGVLCSYDKKECENENFYKKIKDIEKVINVWRMRNLSLQGRIQVIKTFIISKFQYQFANDSIPAQFVKRLEKIVHLLVHMEK